MSEKNALTEQELLNNPQFTVKITEDFDFEIANYDEMLALIMNMNDRYKHAGDNITDLQRAKKDLALIRKLPAALDDRRKEIAKPYQDSLKEFKAKIDNLITPLNEGTIKNLSNAIKEKEALRKNIKADKIRNFISELAFNYPEVNSEDVEINPKWLNASTFDKEIREGILDEFERLEKIRKQHDSDVMVIQIIANKGGIDPSGWVAMLESGFDVQQVIERMNEAEERKRVETESLENHNQKIVDTDTGEVVAHTATFTLVAPMSPVQVAYIQNYLRSENVQYSMSRTEDK